MPLHLNTPVPSLRETYQILEQNNGLNINPESRNAINKFIKDTIISRNTDTQLSQEEQDQYATNIKKSLEIYRKLRDIEIKRGIESPDRVPIVRSFIGSRIAEYEEHEISQNNIPKSEFSFAAGMQASLRELEQESNKIQWLNLTEADQRRLSEYQSDDSKAPIFEWQTDKKLFDTYKDYVQEIITTPPFNRYEPKRKGGIIRAPNTDNAPIPVSPLQRQGAIRGRNNVYTNTRNNNGPDHQSVASAYDQASAACAVADILRSVDSQ
jgi:hypothetical protein